VSQFEIVLNNLAFETIGSKDEDSVVSVTCGTECAEHDVSDQLESVWWIRVLASLWISAHMGWPV